MMKAAIIFTLLLTTVLCRPARKGISSSESSEEQVKPGRGKQHRALALPQETAVVQKTGVSDESAVTSEEEAIVNIVSAVKSVITNIFSETTSLPDPSATPDTTSDQSQDDDDDDDNSEDTEEDESEEDESGEPSTVSPVTAATESAVGTEDPTADTPEPITATIVYDQGRGDSLGRFPSDYKSNMYGEDKSYQKIPSPYKSYEYMDGVKKMAYDMPNGNEVEKGLKVFKALQVHADILEEDTSTPDVESQGLDASSPDQEASPKQALLPSVQEQEVSFSPSDATATDSSSATTEEEEEEVESTANPSESASASDESEDSEDATATPGAADSQSDESDSVEGDSEEDGAVVVADTVTDVPQFFTAK